MKNITICHACGSDKVKKAKDFDMFCTNAETTLCRCKECGVDWYEDKELKNFEQVNRF